MIQKQINGLTFQVRRMTVREIYALFEQEKERDGQEGKPEEQDMLGRFLFEDASLEDVIRFTDLTREQLMEMTPQAVEQVISTIRAENPHFFAACRRMADTARRATSLFGNFGGSILRKQSSH